MEATTPLAKTRNRPSCTKERQQSFYPTPQNESKLNVYVDRHTDSKISKNSIINDAVSYYFKEVLHM